MRKNCPKKIIGNLSNHERILEILELRISNLMDAANENGYIEKTSAEKSNARIVRSKRSKDDLQPYIGSNLCRGLSQNLDKWAFSLSRNSY